MTTETNKLNNQDDDVNWQPLRTVKISFDSRKLVKNGDSLVTFKPTAGALAFGGAFVLVGIVISLLMSLLVEDAPWFNPFGVIFVAIGLLFFYLVNRRISFDRKDGFYRKGRHSPRLLLHIRALQLLFERVASGKSGKYELYQLNLLLSDGERLNVVSYTDSQNAVGDAKLLADFLGIPLLSTVEFDEYIPA